MAYSADILDKHVEIWQRIYTNDGDRGRGSGTPEYQCVGWTYASVRWTRGMKNLREGSIEAYDVVMIRMRWNNLVNHDCQLTCEGKTYQILQLNEDKRDNQIQIIAQELMK